MLVLQSRLRLVVPSADYDYLTQPLPQHPSSPPNWLTTPTTDSDLSGILCNEISGWECFVFLRRLRPIYNPQSNLASNHHLAKM